MNISSLNNPVTTTSTGNNGASFPVNTAHSATQGKSQKTPEINDLDASGFQDKRQTALQIVNRTLTMAYEKISSKGQAASAEYEGFEPLTAEKVAGNILGFIERRLQLDVAEGATQEELKARLEAGLAGFKKGFAEASEKLEALSLLSPEIKADIGKTYDLVLEGVDALRSKFIKSTEADEVEPPVNQTPDTLKSSDSKKSSPAIKVPDFLPASSSYLGYGNYEYGRAREFSFELTTREGDKISIKATASEGFALETARAGQGNSSVSALNASYSSSQSFSLIIDGELNEEELTAINDLLGRVNELAGQFFAGNLDSAFDKAMNLGYDADQIGNFSLNLAQAEIQQVTQAYQEFKPGRENGNLEKPNLLIDQLLPVGNFIKDLLASLDRASEFKEPKSLLTHMAEKVTGETEVDQQQGQRFRDFVEKLLSLELN